MTSPLPDRRWTTSRPAPLVAAWIVGLVAACAPPPADPAVFADSPAAERVPSVPARTTPDDGFPREIALDDGTLTLNARPRRLFPASATAVDFALALTERDALVALPRQALLYSPAAESEAERAPFPEELLFDRYETESVLATRPDLVLVHTYQNPATTARLRELGVAVVVLPDVHTRDDLARTLRLLGRVLGAEDRAEQVLTELNERVERLRARTAGRSDRVLAYTNFGSGASCPGSETAYDVLIEMAGLRNAASEAGLVGFASVDHEWLLRCDPDWILVSTNAPGSAFSASEAALRGEEALATLRAVREDRILRLPSELYASTSHHLVSAAERLVDELLAR